MYSEMDVLDAIQDNFKLDRAESTTVFLPFKQWIARGMGPRDAWAVFETEADETHPARHYKVTVVELNDSEAQDHIKEGKIGSEM